MKFFTYAALVFGVSAITLNQQSSNGLDLADEDLALTYPHLAPLDDDLAMIRAGNDTEKEEEEEDEDDDEDDLLKAVKAVIDKKGSVTMKDIRMIIKGKMKAMMKEELKKIMKEVRKGFKACDTNGDKKVTGAEFEACMKDAGK